MLTLGDVTKKEEILDKFTLREVLPYYKERLRNVIFREMIIGFLMGDSYRPYRIEVKKKAIIGGFCQGKYVKKCRRSFGNALEVVCKTCPN
ncbi:MAG: hypothetical protein RMJ39_10425 [Deltaproteobacteria bacterium]|nr:hypothetical protein [Deltaproteobacteria bacterium]